MMGLPWRRMLAREASGRAKTAGNRKHDVVFVSGWSWTRAAARKKPVTYQATLLLFLHQRCSCALSSRVAT